MTNPLLIVVVCCTKRKVPPAYSQPQPRKTARLGVPCSHAEDGACPSWEIDAGLTQDVFGGRLRFEPTYFYREVHNLIEEVADELPPVAGVPEAAGAENVASTRMQGVELIARAQPFSWLTTTSNYTYLNFVTASGTLVNRPRHRGAVTAAGHWDDVLASGDRATATALMYLVGRRDSPNPFNEEEDEADNTATTSFTLTVLDPRTDPSSLPSNNRGPLTNGPEEKSLAQGSQFYSCFISYSSKDEIFAKRLHSDLCACGITCFFAPEDLKIGAKLRSDIDKAIRLCDKVLIVLSEHSIESGWVEKEVEAAFEKERQQNCLVLFPIRLDDAVMSVSDGWAADIRRTRNVGDFRPWKTPDGYSHAFERLLRDLKQKTAKSDSEFGKVPEALEGFRQSQTTGLVTLLFSNIVGLKTINESLKDHQGVAAVQSHHACLRRLLTTFQRARAINTATDTFLILFVSPSEAVRFALLLQSELRKLDPLGIRDRIGIHVGEVVIQRSVGMPHPQEVTGLQVDLCSRVMSLGEADQILMTRAAFENARYAITEESIPGLKRLAWMDYGSYRIEGFSAEVDICEVGEIGSAYLRSPKGDTAAHRRSASSQEAIRNWTELMGRTPPLDVTGTVGKDPTENLKSAILLAHSDGFLATWSMVHNQVRASNFLMPNNVGDSGWRLVGAADFDGDSQPDLLFQHLDGSIALWEMDGLRMKRSSFLSPCNAGAPDWRVVGTRGTDSVGEWQVFFQNTNGDLAIWRMEGRTLKKVEALHPSRLDPGWSVAGISDLNGDGTTELVLQHVDGNLMAWFLDGLERVQTDDIAEGVLDNNWRIGAILDLNGDNKSDLVLQHKDGRCAVWFMDGTGLKSTQCFQPCANPGAGWQVVGPK